MWKIIEESLERNHPQIMGEMMTPAIKTVQKFAGIKLTKFAYLIYTGRHKND